VKLINIMIINAAINTHSLMAKAVGLRWSMACIFPLFNIKSVIIFPCCKIDSNIPELSLG